MKVHFKPGLLFAVFCLPLLLNAGEAGPGPFGATSPAVDPADYRVLRRRIETVEAEAAAPLAGMTPVRRRISITVDEVADPHLPAPAPPPEAVRPDPQALAAFRAKMALRPRPVFIHLSATVHDGENTLLRWFPNGQKDMEMIAWSNIDFNLLAGNDRFVHNGKDYHLLIGITNENSALRRRMAARLGKSHTPPDIPPLPPDEDPGFVVIKGDAADAAALEPITVLHDIFRADPAGFKAGHEARVCRRNTRGSTFQPQALTMRNTTMIQRRYCWSCTTIRTVGRMASCPSR